MATEQKDDIPSFPTTSEGYVARYAGPSHEEMTEKQKEIRDAIVATRKRTGLSGPFGPWLAIPDIAQPAQALGRACRYGTSLSFRESELVILLTGAKTRSHAEFDIHQGEALRAGIPLHVISAIPRDDDFSPEAVKTKLLPLLDNDREISMAKFSAELLETYSVSDELYAETKEALGGKDSVLVEITSIIGYYTYVSYTLNAFRIPSKSASALHEEAKIIHILMEELPSEEDKKVEEGLRDLAELCSVENANDKENRRTVYQFGGPLAVIRKFKKYRANVLIQRQACRALQSLSFDVEACKIMGELGGVEAVVATMDQHKNDLPVQEYGIAAIGNLVHENKDNAQRLLDCGGLEAVASAMRSHAKAEALQSHGCYTFANVCNWAEYMPPIAKAGGFSAIAKAMETYTDVAGVQENGRIAWKARMAV